MFPMTFSRPLDGSYAMGAPDELELGKLESDLYEQGKSDPQASTRFSEG
jgi:hypothetical protein